MLLYVLMVWETALATHSSSVCQPTKDLLIWLEGSLSRSHLEKYHHLEVCKTSVCPGYHSVMTRWGQEIPITTSTVQSVGMQTFWRKLASFSDRCAFVLVPLFLDLSSMPAVQLLLHNGGRLEKQDLITCGYKLIFCPRFHSSRTKNTQYLFRNK